jgi:hypothetical protein
MSDVLDPMDPSNDDGPTDAEIEQLQSTIINAIRTFDVTLLTGRRMTIHAHSHFVQDGLLWFSSVDAKTGKELLRDCVCTRLIGEMHEIVSPMVTVQGSQRIN